MRDPQSPGWPERGTRTDDVATARSWRAAYEEHWTRAGAAARERATGRYSTLRAGVDAWLSHREAQNADSTVSGSRTALTHLMEYVGEQTRPQAVSSAQIQQLWDDFLGQGYQASSVRNTRHHVSKFFTWLGTDPNPVASTKIPKQPQKDVRPWDPGQRRRIREAADRLDQQDAGEGLSRRLVVELLFGTGTRIQEAAAADWQWISRRSRIIRVVEQIARASNAPKRLKDGVARTAVVLREWWDHHRDDGRGLILPGRDGSPIRHRRLHDIIVEILRAAGLKEQGKAAHQFRHTYAFLFLRRGGTMEQLQKSLGHKKIQTTQEYYDHFDSRHAARAGVRAIYRSRRPPRRSVTQDP